jgi:hypothetical protein
VRRGRRVEAFSLLREAMQRGLSPAQALGIETDPDLKALHEDARFAAIIFEAKQHAAAAQEANYQASTQHVCFQQFPSESAVIRTGTNGPESHESYLEVISGGGGRLRCFSHSRLMFWSPLFFGSLSRSGMKICRPASGVIRV